MKVKLNKIENRHIFFGIVVILTIGIIIYLSYQRTNGVPSFARKNIHTEYFASGTNTGNGAGTGNSPQVIDQTYEVVESESLIVNGSFQLGKDIKQMVEKQGGNSIITMSNPGSSSNVLQQTQVSDTGSKYRRTFYLIQLENLQPNRNYLIEAFIMKTVDWNGKDYDFNVLMQPSNTSYFEKAELRSGDGLVKEQVELSNGKKWNRVEFAIHTPINFNGTMQIYIGYNPENTAGYRYMTGFKVRQYLENAYDYPITSGLQCYLNGVNCNSYNGIGNVWKDISDNSNDFAWNAKPNFNSQTGQFLMNGYTATGPNGFRFLNQGVLPSGYKNQFSLIMDPQIPASQASTTAKNLIGSAKEFKDKIEGYIAKADNPSKIELTTNDELVLLIQGNKNIALAVFWPRTNGEKIRLILADTLYETKNPINPNNNSMYSFIFTGTKFVIFEGSSIIFNREISPLYFSHQPVKINPIQSYTGLLRYMIFYNRVLSKDEILRIQTYNEENNKASNKYCIKENRPDLTEYTLDLPVSDDSSDDAYCAYIEEKVNRVKRAVQLRIQGRDLTEEEKASIQKEEEDRVYTERDRRCLKKRAADSAGEGPYDLSLGPNCPRMFKDDDGTYYIQAVTGSEVARIYGRSGRIPFGQNEQVAQKVYELNHPQCVKKPEATTKPKEGCPFVIQRDFNPCRCPSCADVDWTKNPLTQNISPACKKSIRNYCETYSDIEGGKGQACYYWGEGKNLPEAREFRNYFGEMDQCDFKNADISKHPDAKKYIKKDIVSSVCASCPLDSYEKPKDPRKIVSSALRNILNLP